MRETMTSIVTLRPSPTRRTGSPSDSPITTTTHCAGSNGRGSWSRMGPALGLMGTLIPLAPALAGLADGNVTEVDRQPAGRVRCDRGGPAHRCALLRRLADPRPDLRPGLFGCRARRRQPAPDKHLAGHFVPSPVEHGHSTQVSMGNPLMAMKVTARRGAARTAPVIRSTAWSTSSTSGSSLGRFPPGRAFSLNLTTEALSQNDTLTGEHRPGTGRYPTGRRPPNRSRSSPARPWSARASRSAPSTSSTTAERSSSSPQPARPATGATGTTGVTGSHAQPQPANRFEKSIERGFGTSRREFCAYNAPNSDFDSTHQVEIELSALARQ